MFGEALQVIGHFLWLQFTPTEITEEDFCVWVNFPLYYSLHLGNRKEKKEYKKAFNRLKVILSGKAMYILYACDFF